MRILLIKTSSMGDIIHMFPALTDAGRALPTLQVDWVVEAPFATLASWHPQVKRVIPIALRSWRKQIFSRKTFSEWKRLYHIFQERDYDLILDAQGLLKSASLMLLTRGTRAGLDFHSARESLASLFYQKKYKVNFYQHAIVRMRELCSQALHYPLPETPPEFNLQLDRIDQSDSEKYLVFLHGTTWASKEWPETYWIALANLAHQANYKIKISGGNETEMQRAFHIQKACENVDVLSSLDIPSMARLLSHAAGAVSVDTGFGHLAAALEIPVVSLYGATNPAYTGAIGKRSVHLAADFPCAPCLRRQCHYQPATPLKPACYTALTPARVWEQLEKLINNR